MLKSLSVQWLIKNEVLYVANRQTKTTTLCKFSCEEAFNLLFFVYRIKIDLNTARQEDDLHDSVDEEIEAELKVLFAI